MIWLSNDSQFRAFVPTLVINNSIGPSTMGKKRTKRIKPTVIEVKPSEMKSEKEVHEFIRGLMERENRAKEDFSTFVSKELESFQLNANETPCNTMSRLGPFLADDSRRDNFQHFRQNKWFVVIPVTDQKVEELFEEGEVELASVWILMSIFGSQRTEHWVEVYLCLRECKKSRLFVTRWLLGRRLGWLKANHKCKLVNIIYSSGGDCGPGDQSTSIWMEPTTKLTTLLMLIESKMLVSNLLTDYDVLLNLPEYSFAIDPEFMNKTLDEIGLCGSSTVEIKPKSNVSRGSRSTKRRNQKKRKESKRQLQKAKSKNGSSNSKKSGNPNCVVDYGTNEDEDEKKHRFLLDQLFHEAFDVFKVRRQRLNDLAIKKCPPKQRVPNQSKLKPDEPEPVSHCCSSYVGSKAGRSFFPILVGHEEYLYKSSKASSQTRITPQTLDLHGCTKEEAFHMLDSYLPKWIDEAMKEDTYKLPINIISGKGSQVISDAVEQWIRANRNVANRFV